MVQRSKISIACEACRKRKGKCNGIAPCPVCVKHGFKCEFITNRQRRGPRPKATQRPLPSSELDTTADTNSKNHPAAEPCRAQGELNTNSSLPPVEGTVEITSAVQESRVPSFQGILPWRIWKDDLDAVLHWEWMKPFPRSLDRAILLNLMGHLIELFWSHVNLQQSPVLFPTDFYRLLRTRECPAYLCHSMCAASAKFSCHALLTGASEEQTNMGNYFASVARSELQMVSEPRLLHRVQALCILILYEASRGNGVQAWCDNATATSLIQIIRLNPKGLLLHEDISVATATAQSFLTMNQYLQSLGYPALTASILPVLVPPISDLTLSSEASIPDVTSELLCFLLTIKKELKELCRTDVLLPPWYSSSRFMEIRRQLEAVRLQHPDKFNLDLRQYSQAIPSDGTGPGTQIMCIVVYHCCIIALNKEFLPRGDQGVPVIGNNILHCATSVDSTSPIFQAAPKFFLQERINTCMDSVVVICNLCCDVVSSKLFIFPPLLGYACFQAGIVLLTMLRSTTLSERWNISRYLKITLAILSLSKEIFAPAHAWIDFLLAYQKLLCGGGSSRQSHGVRNNYEHLKEPPFLPLEIKMPSTATAYVSSNEVQVHTDERNVPPRLSPKSDEEHVSWMKSYHSLLEEDLASIDQERASILDLLNFQMQHDESQDHVLQTSLMNENSHQRIAEHNDALAASDISHPVLLTDMDTAASLADNDEARFHRFNVTLPQFSESNNNNKNFPAAVVLSSDPSLHRENESSDDSRRHHDAGESNLSPGFTASGISFEKLLSAGHFYPQLHSELSIAGDSHGDDDFYGPGADPTVMRLMTMMQDDLLLSNLNSETEVIDLNGMELFSSNGTNE